METAAFPNSVEFGEFIVALRDRIPRETIARHGGPSDTYQSRIEGGDEMQISADTIAKYSAALSALSFDDVTPSFFTAAAQAFSQVPAGDGSAPLPSAEPDPDRGFRLGKLASETSPRKELYAGRLVAARGKLASTLAGVRGPGVTFLDVAANIAAKHHAVTLIPWSTAAGDKRWTGYWWQVAHTTEPRYAPYARIGAYPDGVPRKGYPVLVQAGSSEDGKSFAARHAEAIFTAHQTYDRAADFYGDIKARTAAAGRDPDGVLVLPGIVPFIGSTEAEARELAQRFDDLRLPEYGLTQLAWNFETDPSVFELDEPLPDHILARPKLQGSQSRSDLIIEMAQRENLTVRQILSRLGGGRGHFTFVGTPDQAVDTIVAWFEGGAADGFNIMAPALPSGLETFIDQVLPILRHKGLFREDYQGTTLREHYGLPLPVNQFRRHG